MGLWTGVGWFRIGSSAGLLWTRYLTFGVHTSQYIFWSAKLVSTHQEGLHYMEFIYLMVRLSYFLCSAGICESTHWSRVELFSLLLLTPLVVCSGCSMFHYNENFNAVLCNFAVSRQNGCSLMLLIWGGTAIANPDCFRPYCLWIRVAALRFFIDLHYVFPRIDVCCYSKEGESFSTNRLLTSFQNI
jgi:hypothetical protein